MPEGTLCARYGQWNQKQNSKVRILNPQFYPLSILKTLHPFLKQIPQSFIWPGLQYAIVKNHITITIPLISPSWFLISADIPATFHSLLTVIILIMYALPSLFLLDISNQSRPHPYAWSSIDSFDVLFLILLEGNRGRICGTVILKSAVIYSNVLGLQIHSLLTHRLTDQLPVLQDLFMVSVVSAYTIAHSIQYNNVLCNL